MSIRVRCKNESIEALSADVVMLQVRLHELLCLLLLPLGLLLLGLALIVPAQDRVQVTA